jgi:hypothetical protein
VTASQVDGFLDSFPTRRLVDAGFEEAHVDGLELLGCSELGPARRLTERHLALAFGQAGKDLHAAFHPKKSRRTRLYQPPPTVHSHFELDAPCSHPGDLLPILAQLNDRAAAGLGSHFAGQVRIILDLEGREPIRGARVLPYPTSRADTLERFVIRLGSGMLTALHKEAQSNRSRPVDIDRVEVVLASLMTGDLIQASLFGEKLRKVTGAVGDVHRKYPNAIKRGMVRDGAHFHEDRFGLRVWGA